MNDRQSFNHLASGYASRAESLSLFGSYPLEEARQLVNGLFGAPYIQAEVEARYSARPLTLQHAELIDGLYFYQGAVRQTRRIVNRQDNRHLDLHPGEDILLDLFDGAHTLNDLATLSQNLRTLPATAHLPVRKAIDLVVQLDMLGVLA